jgi:hypothetical protein
MATYAGPAFSFAAMWLGWWLLARSRSTGMQRHLGFATIFAQLPAQLPAQRLHGPLGVFNDEYCAASHMFGRTRAGVSRAGVAQRASHAAGCARDWTT